MRKRALTALSLFVGLTIAAQVLFRTWAPNLAYAQDPVTCPNGWMSYNCVTMPPPNDAVITGTAQPGGTFAGGFNSSDQWCVELYGEFQSAYNASPRRTLVADMPTNIWGAYYGSGAGQGSGTFGIANATYNLGNNWVVVSTAIHEVAHDWGCSDLTNDPGNAAHWADYCVPSSFPPPPPPPLCNYM